LQEETLVSSVTHHDPNMLSKYPNTIINTNNNTQVLQLMLDIISKAMVQNNNK
jgi:hypothetical protein